jgi:hypothetical protein
MNKTSKKRGGKRSNSGRKPVEDKKIQLPLYVPESRIELLGKEYCKSICMKAIEAEYNLKIME